MEWLVGIFVVVPLSVLFVVGLVVQLNRRKGPTPAAATSEVAQSVRQVALPDWTQAEVVSVPVTVVELRQTNGCRPPRKSYQYLTQRYFAIASRRLERKRHGRRQRRERRRRMILVAA